MVLLRLILRPILISMLLVLFGTGLLFAAELDDSTLFVEGFNAFQKKDYLLAIEKIGQLNQLFPDTPLRDVSLLLLARAALKSGDNELAGNTVNRFNTEFSNSLLMESIEDKLLVLGNSLKNGEKLVPSKSLQLAARTVRDQRLAAEHATAAKAEQVKPAGEKSGINRIALNEKEAEHQLRLKVAAVKTARENIILTISVSETECSFEVGKRSQLLFELTNIGAAREEFKLSTTAAPEYEVRFNPAGDDRTIVERVLLDAGRKFKGVLSFKVPSDKIDGYKAIVPINVISGRFADVFFTKDIMINASAPLIRAVVKPDKTKVFPGESFRYGIILINAGTLSASDLLVRVIIPSQLEMVETKNALYKSESSRTVVYKLEPLLSGGLKELVLPVKVKDVVEDKSDFSCLVEVNNLKLNRKEYFSSIPATLKLE